MRFMIFEVNQMFINLATKTKLNETGQMEYMFPNVYHIDCRGIATGYDDWFDEIHLKSHRFKIIADAYQSVIRAAEGFDVLKKVIRAKDFDR